MKNSTYFSLSKATLMPTTRCNLECIYCRKFPYISYSAEEEMSIDEIKEIVDKLVQIGIDSIRLSGGEPFLFSDLWKIISYIKSVGLSCSINTNGTLLDEKAIELLKKYDVNEIRISLDSVKKETNDTLRGYGVYEIVTAAISSMSRQGLKNRLVLDFVVTNKNFRDIPEFLRFAKRLGLRTRIKRLHPCDPSVKELLVRPKEFEWVCRAIRSCYSSTEVQAMIQTLKQQKGPCDMGRKVLIGPEGTMTLCVYLPFSVGNIFEIRNPAEIVELYRDDQRAMLVRGRKLKGKCVTCDIREVCGGGCRADSYWILGDLFDADPLCWYEEKDSKDPTVFPLINSGVHAIPFKKEGEMKCV